MDIVANTVVSLDVELSDIWGNLIERTEAPVQYLHGGYNDIFPVVEAALEGKGVESAVEVRLEPEDAFGDYDEMLLRVQPRGAFPETLEVGMRFEGEAGGDDDGRIFTVTDIADNQVVLDGNHALSGMALKFACTVVGVRPANADEIANGSADDTASVIVRAVP
jgi:FKBP-type peptidyl-prolyl cis-trans isomerase SlyD